MKKILVTDTGFQTLGNECFMRRSADKEKPAFKNLFLTDKNTIK